MKIGIALALCVFRAGVEAVTGGDIPAAVSASTPFMPEVSKLGIDTPATHDAVQHDAFSALANTATSADDMPDWRQNRTMLIGVGTNKLNIADKSRNLYLQSEIAGAIGYLCPAKGLPGGQVFGFKQCLLDDGREFKLPSIKEKFVVSIGAAYWPYGHAGLREALAKAVAETFQTVAENNCYDEKGHRIESQELYSAPDMVMVRVDDIGWMDVFVQSTGLFGPALEVCDGNGNPGDNGNRIIDCAKDNSRPDVAKALGISKEGIKVVVRCGNLNV